jgi:hypothetical protein
MQGMMPCLHAAFLSFRRVCCGNNSFDQPEVNMADMLGPVVCQHLKCPACLPNSSSFAGECAATVISLSKEANMADLLGPVMRFLLASCLLAALFIVAKPAAGECAAPVISLSKEANMADLLGPVMRRADAEVVHRHVPWAMKKNKAFFRCDACCFESLWCHFVKPHVLGCF